MHRRLFNDLNTLKRRIGALEKKESEDPFVPAPTGSIFLSGSLTSVGAYKGDILLAGTGSEASIAGSHLVYLDPTKQWRRAAGVVNQGSSEMLGIALSAAPHSDGVLVQGVFRLSSSYVSGALGAGAGADGTFTVGVQVYMHQTDSGSFTTAQPTGSGEAVRVVGHSIDTEVIYFNPSQDYIDV